MPSLARRILEDLFQGQGWSTKFDPPGLENDWHNWFTIQKDLLIIDVYIAETRVWMSKENIEEFDWPNGKTGHNITHGPEINITLEDPESIAKIQEYLRNICQKS